ncbi:MAG: DUF342 domain-containing protein, partial [Vallitaleaceae bacterium]|nr:DUF342 domain-containing protein [Vallitaleaceae bacterium]
MEIYNGFFDIKERVDGYYVEVYPPQEKGVKVEMEQVIEKLQKMGVEYDLITLIEAFKNIDEQPIFKVMPIKTPGSNAVDTKKDEKCFRLSFSEDQMRVYLKFFAVNDSANSVVSVSDIIDDARRIKVAVPLDEAAIAESIAQRKLNVDYLIASGTPAIDFVEARVEYLFKTEKDYRPEVDKDGNVNYHKLHVVANVLKGQLLARLIPGIEGKSGSDLFGNEIKPKKARLVKLKRGKNVLINETGTQLYADVDGLVKLEDEKVIVNDTFDIPGNVGSTTGDVEFLGS